jgi:excisionase family DNA binding protein
MSISAVQQPQAGAVLNPAILTKREAAIYLKVSQRFLERATKQGRLRAYKIGSKIIRFKANDLEAFLASGSSLLPSRGKAVAR